MGFFDIFKKKEEPAAPAPTGPVMVAADAKGTIVPMESIPDDVFAQGILGKCCGIEPAEGKLYAPADAMVDNLFDTHHAVSLVTSTGAELLLHVGIDTVKLGGRHFTAHVQNGQKVKKGDLLISFDREAIQAEGYLCTTPLIVCNTDDYSAVKPLASGSVQPGQDLLQLDGGAQG